MQNLTPYFDFPPPYCLFTMGGSEEDLRVFTSETCNANAKWAKFWQFLGAGGQVVQKLSIFTPKGTSLPESASFKPFCATIG